MPRTEKVLVSFNAGELSPMLDARLDLAQSAHAARTLQNMVVDREGGATRRHGTRFIASVKGQGIPEPLQVVDSFASSGQRGVDVWTLTVEVTLSPFAAMGTDAFLNPVIVLDGTFDGTIVLYACDCVDAANNIVWATLYRPQSSPGVLETGHEVFGPPGVQALNAVDAFQVPAFGEPEYDPTRRQHPTLTPGVYYRFRVYGQVDPDPPGNFGNFVFSQWFTLAGGFEPEGFTP